ncbi:hypothetical protein [Sulfolobus sp. E11-6]|uniref:hypothetical protein n=1 Tax=Sulfolobus sp. E11-6 TaxID=2663020 RepID=UPI001297EBD4|nr:hypothetical protein [Sulfolobus sp. E11-6]QGA68920.1 hypothetical protein GFS33_09495 [Sulfolobus sp. E11-6]
MIQTPAGNTVTNPMVLSTSNNNNSYTQPEFIYTSPIVLDNEAGIIVRFSNNWSRIEYHDARVVVYRDDKGKISILEVEYIDEE